jgi:MFS family permease
MATTQILWISTLQFFVSPKIGALSDKYGRKRVLLITMIGNILSAVVCVRFLPLYFYRTQTAILDGYNLRLSRLICFRG